MLSQNQTKKSKPSAKKATKTVNSKTLKPLSLQEIAMINATDLPETKAPNAEDLAYQKLLSHLFEDLLKCMTQYFKAFGKYYSNLEVMNMLGIKSKNTLNTWMHEKGLPHYQVGNKTVIKKSDLEEFLKPHRKVNCKATALRKITKAFIPALLMLSDAGDALIMAV